jgi:hypothetical protein
MEKKQTAVEWLIKELVDQKIPMNFPSKLFNQALEIEKEHIIDAHLEGQKVFNRFPTRFPEWDADQAKQYYNKKYGKETDRS